MGRSGSSTACWEMSLPTGKALKTEGGQEEPRNAGGLGRKRTQLAAQESGFNLNCPCSNLEAAINHLGNLRVSLCLNSSIYKIGIISVPTYLAELLQRLKEFI